MVRILIYIAVAYVALVLMIFLMQRQLLYFPHSQAPTPRVLQWEGLQSWPRPEDYRALVSATAPGNPKATIVLFHGNAGGAADRGFYAHALEPLGYRVVLAEYPGYGGRDGELSEKALVADAKQTVALVYAEFGGPIFVWGESLGSGIASAVAADRTVPVAGLVLITPFDSLPALAQTLYWFMPVRWLIRDKFDNVANLQYFDGPVVVMLAGRDEVVPERHTINLYASIPGPKKLRRFDDAGHNGWPAGPDESWWREAMDFVTADNRFLPETPSAEHRVKQARQ